MSILDKVNAKSRSIVQNFTDQETANYIEAGLLYQIVVAGRFHTAVMNVLYNHAENDELKTLIKEAIDHLVEKTQKYSEDFLMTNKAALPNTQFTERPLDRVDDIPHSAHFRDMEIAMIIQEMHGASQMALLAAISQSYHLDTAARLRKELNMGFDWAYRLQQLMLSQNWLPEIAKVNQVVH